MTIILRATSSAIVILACVAVACSRQPRGTAESPRDQVGIYDSRAIAVAWAGSEFFEEEFKEWKSEHDRAKAAGDEKRVAEVEAEAVARQDLLHRQGFSTAPVDDILELIKDQLPKIAERAGVVAIVSKWDEETLAKYGSAEQVDITMALVEAFKPNERQLGFVKETLKQPPIPLEELERQMAEGGH